MDKTSLKTSRLIAALVGAGVIGGAGASLVQMQYANAANATDAQAIVGPSTTPTTPAAPGPVNAAPVAPPDFAKITEQYGPAVVNVQVTGTTKVSNGPSLGGRGDPFGNDPFFEFFKRFGGQDPRGGSGGRGMAPHEMPTRGQGSGFIVDPSGIILTNAHVVRDAKEVTVKLTDRREYTAKVLGADPRTDVAVLKIDAKNLPVVAIGDPNK
ncbi:MAG: trypsin-like peptidase domain-containing protein, partial [Burkholderiales bacterium]